MRDTWLALSFALVLMSGCSSDKPSAYQGYVEGEYVHVASPVGGRLQRLLVQRGQTIDARAALFKLEADEETAAKQQADEQLKAAQAQLADLRVGRRSPELEVVRAQLAQAQAAEEQAAQQLRRDEAQFDIGGIARAQLDDSRSNLAQIILIINFFWEANILYKFKSFCFWFLLFLPVRSMIAAGNFSL